MKKIIRHVLYKTRCQFCGTEFAFEKSDCHVRPTAGNKKILPFTECPNCGKETPAIADQSTEIKLPPAREIEEAHADRIQQQIDEYETAYQAFNLIKDKNAVMHIAKMQQQIDTFKAALLHASERILHANKCNMVVIDPLDDCDKQNINTIFKFIDEHLNDKSSCANAQKTTY